jgi:hypothetical protein
MNAVRIAVMALFAAMATSTAQSNTGPIPGWDGAWEIDPRSGKITEHMGRPAAMLRGNFPPILSSGADFTDGTIEFDMAALPGGNFVGLVFRYADGLNHENIYFRLHRSGAFEAVQYAPRVNGSGGTWQLYPQFFGNTLLPTDRWVRVRAEVRGSSMELFVGDSARPLIVVPRLRGLTTSGRVGIWGRVNNRPEEWTVAISNVRVRPRPPAAIVAVDTSSLAPGTVTGWRVAGPFAAPDTAALPPLPASAQWIPIAVEELGLVNVTKVLKKPSAGRFVAYLRTTVRSDAARLTPLEIGYSDDIMIWLNGAPVFLGINAQGSRYPDYLGLIAPTTERIYLPLRRGENELLVALSDRVGGWGLAARLVPATKQ